MLTTFVGNHLQNCRACTSSPPASITCPKEDFEFALTAFLQTVKDFGSPVLFLSRPQERHSPHISPGRPVVSISIPGLTSRTNRSSVGVLTT